MDQANPFKINGKKVKTMKTKWMGNRKKRKDRKDYNKRREKWNQSQGGGLWDDGKTNDRAKKDIYICKRI